MDYSVIVTEFIGDNGKFHVVQCPICLNSEYEASFHGQAIINQNRCLRCTNKEEIPPTHDMIRGEGDG